MSTNEYFWVKFVLLSTNEFSSNEYNWVQMSTNEYKWVQKNTIKTPSNLILL